MVKTRRSLAETERRVLTKKLLLTLMMAAFVSVGVACGAPQESGGGGGDGGNGGGGGGEEDFITDLQLGTGSVGGVYFPLGQEMATILTDNIDVEGFNVSSVETGASVDNLVAISNGELQLGLAQNNTAQDAVAGEGEFEGAAVENAGWMGQLYPEAISIITLESTGIETIEDLEGQRIAIGPPGGATRAASELVLEAAGLEEGDYQAFEEDFSTGQTRLQDGNLDASIEVVGVPSSGISELQAVTGEVRLVPLDDDAIAEIEGNSGYSEFVIPEESYDFLDEPVPTVSAFSTLFGSTTQVSEDLGYEITRTVFENADDITLAQSEFITAEDALLGRGNLPLHPGAERYFEEEGLLDE